MFLPFGIYVLSDTLRLRDGNSLVRVLEEWMGGCVEGERLKIWPLRANLTMVLYLGTKPHHTHTHTHARTHTHTYSRR